MASQYQKRGATGPTGTTGPQYQKRTYELVAEAIRETLPYAKDPDGVAALALLAARFLNIFHADNRAFDMERFHKACGFKEPKE